MVYFDTLCIEVEDKKSLIAELAEQLHINFRYEGTKVFISLDESSDIRDVRDIVTIFAKAKGLGMTPVAEKINPKLGSLARNSSFMTHPVFNSYHTEHRCYVI